MFSANTSKPVAANHGQTSTPHIPATLQTGIIETHEGPVAHGVFTVNNLWQGPVGNGWVEAFAGAKTNLDGTAGSGRILLYTKTPNQFGGYDEHPVGTFMAPVGTTGLTCTGVKGSLLLLRSDTGSILTVNLQTHQFQ